MVNDGWPVRRGTVPTTAGDVRPDALGFTLMHEHVAIFSPGLRTGMPWLYDEATIFERCVARLREARDAGIRTVVDVTTVDLGRDAKLVASAAREAGVRVVLATGIWRDVPRYFGTRNADTAAEAFVREITDGVEDTGIRAGIIKVASHESMTPEQETVLRGAARAARATGVAVTTHTLPEARTGLRQLEVLFDEGLPPDRIVIGHSTCTDREYLDRLYAAGVTVGWDQFGTNEIGDERDVLRTLVDVLHDDDVADRTVLGGDFGAFVDWDEALTHSYRHVPDVVVPGLRSAGVSESTIETMTVRAPARLLAPA
jgi:phosphotriesterase-related protein